MANIQAHLHREKTTVEAPDTAYTLKKERERNGQCPDCGIQTYKVKHVMFSGEIKIPITNDKVISGRCLECKPFRSSGVSNNDVPVLVEFDSVIDADEEPVRIQISEHGLGNTGTVGSINHSDFKGIILYFVFKPGPDEKVVMDGEALGTKIAEKIWKQEGSSCTNIWSSFEYEILEYLDAEYPTDARNWREKSYHEGIKKGADDVIAKYEKQCLNDTPDECYDLGHASAGAIAYRYCHPCRPDCLHPNNQVQTTKPSAGLLLLEFAKALYMNISLTNAPSLRLNSTIFRKSARLR
ncbi:LOW QUALITY PROTEIN: hypothetical protein ACHAWO_005324 [Cyclotella atomus]|uniref:Uncharacterized protein n=1 Tax=Cyclotella atomus TaxID=382360 RepID=A0ABD3R644_9STRA